MIRPASSILRLVMHSCVQLERVQNI
jgi:hypothetical protein